MLSTHWNIFPRNPFSAFAHAESRIQVSPLLMKVAGLGNEEVYLNLNTLPSGLSSNEAGERLRKYGPNALAKDQGAGIIRLFWRAVLNPLVVLLATLATISFLTGDSRAGTVMLVMIVLGVGLKLIQEIRAGRAASKLRSLITVNATVLRDGAAVDVSVSQIVPGDIVTLAAGDMVPADVRIIMAKDLFVVQGALTGESFPVEKFENPSTLEVATPIELNCIAFFGTSIESGAATAVVVATGRHTYLGSMSESMAQEAAHPIQTAFEQGITRFTWLMLRFILVMVPLVFLINGLTKQNWVDAFFFALAVAVGLTPEMLPMIVSVCLTKGALSMSRRKVIVKRINAIQNLGAMDVLCVDKTGTLTMDKVILEKHCDVLLREDDAVLGLAYLNSHFQTGLRNVLDRAVLAHTEAHDLCSLQQHTKVDEIPFDFHRRIMSVVVRTPENRDQIISKGAPEAIFPLCKNFQLDGAFYPMDHEHIEGLKKEYEELSADGFRVLAIATRDLPVRGVVAGDATPYSKADEVDLTLQGYVAFLDPPKDSARPAIKALQNHGVEIKVITGDNELVARKICMEVGLPTEHVLLGAEVERMSDEQLASVVVQTALFARVAPAHKQRIIKALQAQSHIVGFMGDGINDAPALRAADVSISVDTAVDIAKESADLILLEKSLMVLESGVVEGRKVFVNILKYVRMGASSNFGNMFSVLGASIFVPFLPMAPIQILANNLLYDLSQTAIPTDEVDPEQIENSRPWDHRQLTRYILCIGPCSSIFDYTTYFMMLYLFNCRDISSPAVFHHSESLFQTGWFVESLLTQTLVIHIIRTNRLPFIQSQASWPLILMSLMITVIGVAIPSSAIGTYFGFMELPALYWPLLTISLLAYVVLTQLVKMWLLRMRWI